MVATQTPHYRHGNPQCVSIFEKTPPLKDGQRSQTGEMTLDLSNHQQGSNEDLAGLGSVWGYIKSALQNTETVPDNDIIRELLTFPRVRDVQWNPTFGDDFVDRNEQDVLALVIQATGEESPNPCTVCRRGLGPFTGCIVVPSTASSATRQKRWQCANCIYVTAKVITCSIKNWSHSRATTAGVANKNTTLTPRRTRKPDNNELGSLPASNCTPSKRTSSRHASSKHHDDLYPRRPRLLEPNVLGLRARATRQRASPRLLRPIL
ncbi:hypothetical protein GE09DRAFT_177331 [Coniochaeta sp. 2T2.1]|nr:hypothetical protein GE09DRAFT_177331 [Coniochaeta sp. 2T2.1]